MTDYPLDADTPLQILAEAISERVTPARRRTLLMVGIHTGGHWVARRLHDMLALPTPLAGLNISFYRDDFSRKGLHPQVVPSDLPLDVEGRHVLLVDDVLYTGRTVRAAMNEIFDYGRPARISLAVLLERSGRELPIRADFCGQSVSLRAGEQIKLTGPQPLKLFRIQTP